MEYLLDGGLLPRLRPLLEPHAVPGVQAGVTAPGLVFLSAGRGTGEGSRAGTGGDALKLAWAMSICLAVMPAWVGSTAAPAKEVVDRIVVKKADHTLSLLSHGRVIKTYHVSLGPNPVGPKRKQGDGKTPEGTYVIDSRNAASKFHLSLHVSYPNAADRARAKAAGVDPGGDIMIHGLGPGFDWVGPLQRTRDWTAGCIAVTNAQIEEIWARVKIGTVVEIRP